MDNNCVINNGNVVLVDPNCANINPNMINGIPQYQDMYIFAELIAESRGRSVIITGNDGGTSKGSSSYDGNNVNFIGNNQNSNDHNHLNFTTNYYDGSTGENIQFESFGITSIKINVNSSYVPQVNIQFVDIRGLSFFNQEKSPYRILFDFPPPIFTLTVKGYYGKMLSYQIHLVNYTSEFTAENGNFIIDANFIAMTFAPLADILFRYVVNIPLMSVDYSLSSETNTAPRNTYELIMKVRNLYSGIQNKIKTDTDSKNYDITDKSIKDINDQIFVINSYKNDENLKKVGIPYLGVKKSGTEITSDGVTSVKSANIFDLKLLQNISEYDAYINATQTTLNIPNKINDKLCILFQDRTDDLQYLYITKYRESLKTFPNLKIGQSDLPPVQKFDSDYDLITNLISPTTTKKYICLDITNYYVKLIKERNKLKESKSNLGKAIGNKVNNLILEELGMLPTIYNIFKIILNDVDVLFKELKSTSLLAENIHNEEPSKSLIVGNNKQNNPEHIYAFPLIINQNTGNCGVTKEERIAPIKLSATVPFPELDFVKKFIDTFQTQARLDEIYKMRESQNSDGTNVWIPLSPIDSKIGGANSSSPYITVGGVSNSPLSLLSQTLEIIIKRFYILSQGIIPYYFYEGNDDRYLKLYAKSEAINLVNSLVNPEYKSNIENNFKNYKTIQNFYNAISDLNIYKFPNDEIKYLPINSDSNSNGNVYTLKSDENFIGITLNIGDVTIRQESTDPRDPIDEFFTNFDSMFSEFLYSLTTLSINGSLFTFTTDNLPYIQDIAYNGIKKPISEIKSWFGSDEYDGTKWRTRFLYEFDEDLITLLFGGAKNIVNGIFNSTSPETALTQGNLLFKGSYIETFNPVFLTFGGNIIEVWCDVLSEFDTNMYNTIIDYNNNNGKYDPLISAVVLLSNFGFTLSPFSSFPSQLNSVVFSKPSIIEMPNFLSAYLGGLIIIFESNKVDIIVDFFVDLVANGGGNGLKHKGMFVFADIYDVMNNLSKRDRENFKANFNSFYSGDYVELIGKLNELYLIPSGQYNTKMEKYDKYYDYLNPNENSDNVGYYNKIIKPLISRFNSALNSQITFKLKPDAYSPSYKSLVNSNTWKTINDKYFTLFFQEVINQLSDENKDKNDEDVAREKILADPDIINQTYYSFKNINDKWLSNLPSNNLNGYPFGGGKPLIDSFVFVDRAMNPIGDTMINAEILSDIFGDTNITLYSALSQILSLNGFEFFPLQNFMSFSGGWGECFNIDTSGEIKKSPVFVCMYIGGSSSYPSTNSNGFSDDGISDISNPGVSDFKSEDCTSQSPALDEQRIKNPNFPWREVNAFRVRFGEQNQSMFTNVKIDSKEYPETNESIQILSRLAGDNKLNAPTPKGQNLYNLYENRAYKATITSMGNVMIQPTQYFQLENVPMFNGAYIILAVEHIITANKMMTTFSGTKILKYPIPRVVNPVVFVGLDDLGIDLDFSGIKVGSASVVYPNDYLISKHMTYYNGISKGSADRRGIDNTPTESELNNVIGLSKMIYDPLCDYFNVKIPTTTVFRGNSLNFAVGGDSGSQHKIGEAMDLDGDSINVLNSNIFDYIVNNLEFDRLIWEGGDAINAGWIHVSYISDGRKSNRKEFAMYNKSKKVYSSYYTSLASFNENKITFYS